MKYRPDMSPEEQEALLDELKKLDECYEDADKGSAGNDPDDDMPFDPIADGWVDKSGRP